MVTFKRTRPRSSLLMGLVIFIATSLVSCTSLRSASKLPQKPSHQALKGLHFLDGKHIKLTDTVKHHKATVLFWWSTSCPCVKRYQKRMEVLQKQFASQKVAFYAVASNADDHLKLVQKVSKERKFQLPIIMDPHGQLANWLGVVSTPATILLDQRGKVQFLGWIDNERRLGVSGRKAYLKKALQEVLSQKSVSLPRTPVYGCTITKSLFAKTSTTSHHKTALSTPKGRLSTKPLKVQKDKKSDNIKGSTGVNSSDKKARPLKKAKPCSCRKKPQMLLPQSSPTTP